jgi:hypothetical protein
MAYKIFEIDGAVIGVRVTDLLRLADQKAVQTLAAELIEKGQKVRILVVIDHFQGWERSAKWDDIGFLMEHGDDIEKIAIVADERWKDQAFLFVGKGLRTTAIEFFPPSALPQAGQWVRA